MSVDTLDLSFEALDQGVMKAGLQAYADRINAGDRDGVIALFAPGATIEDPVGTALKSGPQIAEWFAQTVASRTRITPVAPIRGSHGNAAALMLDVTFDGAAGQRMLIRSLDVCTFDAEGLITSLRGYWGPEDVEQVAAEDPSR
ncbi:MAG: nuclear transport factor 2 family protein [Novosphingobium sp.]